MTLEDKISEIYNEVKAKLRINITPKFVRLDKNEISKNIGVIKRDGIIYVIYLGKVIPLSNAVNGDTFPIELESKYNKYSLSPNELSYIAYHEGIHPYIEDVYYNEEFYSYFMLILRHVSVINTTNKICIDTYDVRLETLVEYLAIKLFNVGEKLGRIREIEKEFWESILKDLVNRYGKRFSVKYENLHKLLDEKTYNEIKELLNLKRVGVEKIGNKNYIELKDLPNIKIHYEDEIGEVQALIYSRILVLKEGYLKAHELEDDKNVFGFISKKLGII